MNYFQPISGSKSYMHCIEIHNYDCRLKDLNNYDAIFLFAAERVSSQLQLSDTDPCGPPPQAGTFAFISNYSVGALVQYRCMNGYVRQSGSEELTCMNNEREGEPLKCRSKCSIPYTLHNICWLLHCSLIFRLPLCTTGGKKLGCRPGNETSWGADLGMRLVGVQTMGMRLLKPQSVMQCLLYSY